MSTARSASRPCLLVRGDRAIECKQEWNRTGLIKRTAEEVCAPQLVLSAAPAGGEEQGSDEVPSDRLPARSFASIARTMRSGAFSPPREHGRDRAWPPLVGHPHHSQFAGARQPG